jgi:hypothetical protein
MMRKKKDLKQEAKEQEEVKVVKMQEVEVEIEVGVEVEVKEDNEDLINSESIINQITLDCLLNKSQYEKYLRRNLTKSINNNDKKFYRKRICNLTKELFKEENSNNIPPDIKYVFDNYIKICINYFKVMDRSDIIQEEYKEYKETTEEQFVSNEELSQSNSLMMRSVKVNPGLDNFVTIKMTKPQEEMIIPQQRDINLRDPKLKKKGIVGKEKKNIPINYDEQDKKSEGTTTKFKTETDDAKEEQQQADDEAKV